MCALACMAWPKVDNGVVDEPVELLVGVHAAVSCKPGYRLFFSPALFSASKKEIYFSSRFLFLFCCWSVRACVRACVRVCACVSKKEGCPATDLSPSRAIDLPQRCLDHDCMVYAIAHRYYRKGEPDVQCGSDGSWKPAVRACACVVCSSSTCILRAAVLA